MLVDDKHHSGGPLDVLLSKVPVAAVNGSRTETSKCENDSFVGYLHVYVHINTKK